VPTMNIKGLRLLVVINPFFMEICGGKASQMPI